MAKGARMSEFRVGILVALGLLATGCGLVVGTVAVGTAVVVGTAGAVGYTVYKGGEAVASGVGSVGSAAKSLVVSDGNLEATADHSVESLYTAAESVMRELKFTEVQGTKDGLVGALQARTAMNEAVYIYLELAKENRTKVKIRVGDGNVAQAELILDRMLAKIAPAGAAGAAS